MAVPREIAWRVFAEEYNTSTYELEGEGERAPSYIVTPLGARINRLFVVGVVTDVENIGSEEEPMWRARLSDPTGVFYLSAGRYQPDASATLSKLKPPAFAAVIGKVRTYKPEEGTLYLSIRPEIVKIVDQKIRDYWVVETCKGLQRRLEAMQEALKMEKPTKEELKALGFSANLAEGIIVAKEHYKRIPVEKYVSMLGDALRFLLPDYEIVPGTSAEMAEEIEEGEEDGDRETAEGESVEEMKVEEMKIEKEPKEKELELLEEKVLKIIETLDTTAKGAAWEGIFEKAKAEKIGKDKLDEALNSLLEKGAIYVPTFGRIRKVVE